MITSAALIMISVFLAFVPNPNPTVKMFGLGLAVAVFVDATIVRLVLVPATMELLGDANWWLPSWLDRILPEDRDRIAFAAVPAVFVHGVPETSQLWDKVRGELSDVESVALVAPGLRGTGA